MKKYVMLLAVLTLFISLTAKDILVKTLDNGMEVVVKKNTSNQSVGLFCFVKTGSNYEGQYLGTGISHYLEHIVSGGSTTLHSEEYYGKREKEIGSMTNAYTTYDKTAFHMQVSKQYFSEALKMLSEHMMFCAFDSMEVSREKQVIAKEIVMRSTPPYSQMQQRYYEKIFSNSHDRYPVIGYVDQFLKLERSHLVDYYTRRYAPNNMIFVVSGNIDVDKCMTEIEETFKDFPRKTVMTEYLPKEPSVVGSRSYTQEFDIQLPYVMINQILSESDLKDYYALKACIDILFSKQYSPLQVKLYQELQLVNYLYSFVDINQNNGSGRLMIGFEAKDTSKLKEVTDVLFSELKKYEKGYFTQKQLNTLIHRYEAENILKDTSVEEECNEIGENMIQYGTPDIFDVTIENVKKLKPEDLNHVIKKYFNPASKYFFYAIPTGQSEQFTQNDKVITETAFTKKDLGNGMSLFHKQNNQTPVVRFTIQLPISTDLENENNVGYLNTMAQMLLKGCKKYSVEKISDMLENKAAYIDINASRDGLSISFTCLKSDVSLVSDILINSLKNPTFPEEELLLYKEELFADSQRDLSDPEIVHSDFRSKMIYKEKRDALNSSEKNEIIQKITRQDLLNCYQNYLKANSALIAVIGDETFEEASVLANDIFSSLKHEQINEKLNPIKVSVQNKTFTQEYPFEQVNLDINMLSPNSKDPDFYVVKVILNILNGSNGRIYKATRGTNDLSYFAYAYDVASPDYGLFRVSSQTSKEKSEELKNVLIHEINRLMTENVSQDEINSAIEENQKQMENYITDKDIASYAFYYENQGIGYDYLFNSIEKLKHVKPEDIKRVANQYFKEKDVIISYPSENLKRMLQE
jgi:zinc protease